MAWQLGHSGIYSPLSAALASDHLCLLRTYTIKYVHIFIVLVLMQPIAIRLLYVGRAEDTGVSALLFVFNAHAILAYNNAAVSSYSTKILEQCVVVVQPYSWAIV